LFSKILIANRGEIACRIIKTTKRLGIATAAVYSDADRDCLHVSLADEAFFIGPPPARESYLNAGKILEAARRCGAEAIHPGYGFLAENADFSENCAKAGIVFIGPPASAIKAMGDKAQAKALMEKAGVPLVPGYRGDEQDEAPLAREADRIGYPVLIKPAAGGGGKGMKIAASPAEFAGELASARREALSAFGDDRILIEKYISHARHVEVQIFGDAQQNFVHLFDRDCSIQRRYQKIIEEAPAPAVPEKVRHAMREAALAAARAVGYIGAGTVEFLYSPDEEAFYFLEMNTRLQVEHPVTEMITGIDLVEWQIEVAAGCMLPLRQEEIASRGHTIEARLYAEDPARDFLPQAGRILRLDFPAEGAALRIDTGMRAGDPIPVEYDPMIAKAIVWGKDRAGAMERLGTALRQIRIAGLQTNLELLRAIAAHKEFNAAPLDTGFIERHLESLLPRFEQARPDALAISVIGLLCERAASARENALRSSDPWGPWSSRTGWRLNEEARETLLLRELTPQGGRDHMIEVTYLRDGWRLDEPGATFPRAKGALAPDGSLEADLDGHCRQAVWLRCGKEFFVFMGAGPPYRFELAHPAAGSARREEARGHLTSPMPGRIAALLAAAGDRVEANQPLLVLEAMKMEHILRAPKDGVLKALKIKLGDRVGEGAELALFETEPPPELAS
jgi:3-methylcrotonyl-CoA carboxylase alpha subunit